jgi:hypothetical protein
MTPKDLHRELQLTKLWEEEIGCKSILILNSLQIRGGEEPNDFGGGRIRKPKSKQFIK